MVRNGESFLNLPRTSCPINIASWILPDSTSDRNSEKPISFSFWPVLPVRTTCQSSTADATITAQKSTVLIVEFTLKTPRNAALYVTQTKAAAGNHIDQKSTRLNSS